MLTGAQVRAAAERCREQKGEAMLESLLAKLDRAIARLAQEEEAHA